MFLHRFRKGRSKRAESISNAPNPSAGLCARCTSIPFNLVTLEAVAARGPERRISDIDNTFLEGCKLCSLLRKTTAAYGLSDQHLILSEKESSIDEARRVGVLLQLTSEQTPSVAGWLSFENPNGDAPGPVPTGLYTRKIAANQVDWTAVKSWMQHCETNHLGHGDILRCEPTAIRLSEFLLIDCNTRKIVHAPMPCKYSALSYVWGSSRDASPPFQWTLPSLAPLVIEDAITCTQALGLRYLWVDRYCIDQAASQTKMHQIQNMDKIYGSAAVTIINATGENSDSGLPGVSQAHRRPQESVSISGRRLTMVPPVAADIASSKWAGRGWTYQESFLSNRRLIFTKSQVYFQCLNMHCCESLLATFKTRSTRSGDNLDTAMQSLPRPVHSGKQAPATILRVFQARLTEYLGRTLSFHSDSLNAFMGVLRHFWFLESPIYHFWGMPFCSRTDEFGTPAYDFLVSLLSMPVDEPNSPNLIRKASFPSWSWAGWKGVTGMEHKFDWITPGIVRSFDVSVAIEDISGRRLDVETYVQQMNSTWDLYQFRPCIYLTGWTAVAYFRANIDMKGYYLGRMTWNTFLSASKESEGKDCIEMHSTFIRTFVTYNCYKNIAPYMTGPWLCFIFFEGGLQHYNEASSKTLVGFILKSNDDGSYMKVGVLALTPREMTRLDDKTARMRLTQEDTSIDLVCEKRTIRLA